MKIAALIQIICLALAFSCAAQPVAFKPEIQTTEVNGTTVHYFEHGKGEPLLFVHGSLGDLNGFRTQIEAFGKEFRVICYSRRFHPPNNPPKTGDAYSMQLHVADLVALLQKLNASPAHVVGHSYGGYIALALAVERPEFVRRVVVAEPPVLSLLSKTSAGNDVQESSLARAFHASHLSFEAGNDEGALRHFVDAISVAPWYDRLSAGAKASFMTKSAELRSEMLTESSTYMLPLACEALRQLKRPILLVSGERSPAVFHLITAELERCLEGESHVKVPGAGHVMQSENKAFFNEAVLEFLRRN